MLSVQDVVKTFPSADGSSPGVHGVSFNVLPGEFVFFVGATGHGKTTLLRLIERRARPDSGRVLLGGADINARGFDNRAHRRRIGVVRQQIDLVEDRTVAENLAMRLQMLHWHPDQIRSRVRELLAAFDLQGRADLLARQHALSGGEQQRLAIARAIAHRPDLLLCDEPTGQLDACTSAGVMRCLNRVSMLGTTVICATHDQSSVDRMGKRVIVIRDGLVASDNPVGRYDLQ